MSPGNILIYAINHRRTGSTIERFHHTIGSNSLIWERTFDANTDILFCPNDVAVVGKDEFYVTNVPPLPVSPLAPSRSLLLALFLGDDTHNRTMWRWTDTGVW